ncbi:MAG: dihydroneopterin aldolase [Calditrichia bacterium]
MKQNNMEYIRLNNIIFYAHHGYYKAERELGQKFEVDVEMECQLSKAIESDSLEHTINYKNVFDRINDLFNNYKFTLLETLADKIAKDLLKNFDISSVRIRVRKPQVRLNGFLDNVEVEVFRKREQ